MSQKVKVLQNDILMYQNLLQANEAGLHKVMHKFLKGKYNTIIHTKEYTIAVGDIPIALVAHMDTVFKFPPTTDMLYFDQEKHVMWSPNGCGHDDRAGIFAIIQIINMGLRPSVILTTGEEQGGIGAMAIVEDYPACPIKDLKFMIELDRQGEDDCVFYQCANENFFKYIKKLKYFRNNWLIIFFCIDCIYISYYCWWQDIPFKHSTMLLPKEFFNPFFFLFFRK